MYQLSKEMGLSGLKDSLPAQEYPRWEHIAQDAGITLRGYGHSADEAFTQMALAVTASIADPRHIQARCAITLECRSPNLESMLIAWVDTLIAAMDTRHQLFCAFDVEIQGHHLQATAWGEPCDPLHHQSMATPKNIQFSAHSVNRLPPDCWITECVATAHGQAPINDAAAPTTLCI